MLVSISPSNAGPPDLFRPRRRTSEPGSLPAYVVKGAAVCLLPSLRDAAQWLDVLIRSWPTGRDSGYELLLFVAHSGGGPRISTPNSAAIATTSSKSSSPSSRSATTRKNRSSPAGVMTVRRRPVARKKIRSGAGGQTFVKEP